MKSVQTYVTCDECGAIDAKELRFSTHGGNYAIDLCETHMTIYENLIRPYVEKAHKVVVAHHVVRKDEPKKSATERATDKRKANTARRHKAKTIEPTEGSE